MSRLTPVVKVLLILNIAIFALQYVLQNYGIDLSEMFALRYFGAETFAPYQLITHMFLHAGLFHILGNMYALYIFGPPLEEYFDSKKFLILYMVAGLGAAVLHAGVSTWEVQSMQAQVEEFKAHPTPAEFKNFMMNDGFYVYDRSTEIRDFVNDFEENSLNQSYISEATNLIDNIAYAKRNIQTVGASGAVFGILAAFGIVFANTKLILLFPPIPIKAKYLVFGYALYEIYAIYQANPTDNVAHFAHIGGFIFGIILVKLWGKRDKPMRWN